MLSGDNSILKRTTDAKEITGVAQIQEEIITAWNGIQVEGIPENWSLNKKTEELQKELQKEDEKATATLKGNDIDIIYKKYKTTINADGSLSSLSKIESDEDITPVEVAGLYDKNTDELIIPWSQLIEENGPIVFNNGKVSTHYDSSESTNSSSDTLDGRLVFSDTVTEIENNGFNKCIKLTGITLDKNLKIIGQNAFNGCSNMKGNLVLPNNITTIGSSAFSNCSSLTGILSIPDNVITIETATFLGCTGFTSVELNNNLTRIGPGAFIGCSGLTGKLILPNSLISIGDSAFSGCTGLTGDLIIPNSVTTLDRAAFARCTGLTGKIVIPNNVNTVGTACFEQCGSDTEKGRPSLEIDTTTIVQGSFALIYCSSITLGEHVTTIMDNGFNGTFLNGELIVKGKNVTIGSGAFSNFSGLTRAVIPYVKSIGGGCFSNCSNMTEIIFSKDITLLPNKAFYGCSNLNKVYYTGTQEEWNSITGFDSENDALVSAQKIYQYEPEF